MPGTDGYAVCRLYVKHRSYLEIDAGESAFVMVDVLDDGEVCVHCSGHARVVVNLYARGKALADGDGLVKIISKHMDTYEL